MSTACISVRRLVVLAPALGLLLLTAGCIPCGMVWLPDSSGFVYPAGKDLRRLQFYDAAKREHRVLIEDTGAQSVYPGVSPDGKRIAVARLRREPGKADVAEIVVYDMTGKEQQRSPEITWRESPAGDNQQRLVPTMVFWDSEGKKIAVSELFEPNPRTAVYDITAKKAQIMDGQLMPVGNTPIRPDGTAFLVIGTGRKTEVFLADWEGKKLAIALDDATFDADYKKSMLSMPFWFLSRWDGNTASVAYKDARIRIDTEKRAGTVEAFAAAEAKVNEQLVQQQYEFPGGVKVRALLTEAPEAKDNKGMLQIRKPDAKEWTALVQQGKPYFGFSPSPDKKLLAIWCVDDGNNMTKIFIVDSSGAIVSEETVALDN